MFRAYFLSPLLQISICYIFTLSWSSSNSWVYLSEVFFSHSLSFKLAVNLPVTLTFWGSSLSKTEEYLLALHWQLHLLLLDAKQTSHWYWRSDFTEFCYWKWILLIDFGIQCKKNNKVSQIFSWPWSEILKQSIEGTMP